IHRDSSNAPLSAHLGEVQAWSLDRALGTYVPCSWLQKFVGIWHAADELWPLKSDFEATAAAHLLRHHVCETETEEEHSASAHQEAKDNARHRGNLFRFRCPPGVPHRLPQAEAAT